MSFIPRPYNINVAFEEWFIKENGYFESLELKNTDGSYFNLTVQREWEIWQASFNAYDLYMGEELQKMLLDGWDNCPVETNNAV